jgi:hypothetical protein
MQINFSNLYASLELMGKGMLFLFLTCAAIVALFSVLSKILSKR